MLLLVSGGGVVALGHTLNSMRLLNGQRGSYAHACCQMEPPTDRCAHTASRLSAGLKRAFEIIGPALKRAIYEAWGPMRYEY